MSVRYTSPAGDTQPVRVDVLRAAVLDLDPAHWHAGTRIGVLVRAATQERLHLVGEPGAGMFIDAESDRDGLLSAVVDGDVPGTITVYPRHQPVTLPARYFLPPASAWAVIAEFIDQPGLPGCARWTIDAPIPLGWAGRYAPLGRPA